MKQIPNLLMITILLMAGCSTPPPEETFRLPDSTPFDSNIMARTAFLDSYEQGYKSGQKGDMSLPANLGPYPTARELGWKAGAAEGYRLRKKPMPQP